MSFTKRLYISNFSAGLPNIKTSLNLATQMRKKDHLLHLDNKRCDFLKSFFVRITTLGLKTWKDFKASLTCLSLGLPCMASTSCLFTAKKILERLGIQTSSCNCLLKQTYLVVKVIASRFIKITKLQ